MLAVLGVIATMFLGINLLFAELYLHLGGISGVRPGSFTDAFFFSVQTLSTIGYGVTHPVSIPANLVVTAQAMLGPILTVFATGVVFTHATRVRPLVEFAPVAVVTEVEGRPTLVVRVRGGSRSSLPGAWVRLTLIRTELGPEGLAVGRMRDLAPVLEPLPLVSLGLTVMHTIDASSPLQGLGPEGLRTGTAGLMVNLVALDRTGQVVQAVHHYSHGQILFGRRFASSLAEGRDGQLRLDAGRFLELEPEAG